MLYELHPNWNTFMKQGLRMIVKSRMICKIRLIFIQYTHLRIYFFDSGYPLSLFITMFVHCWCKDKELHNQEAWMITNFNGLFFCVLSHENTSTNFNQWPHNPFQYLLCFIDSSSFYDVAPSQSLIFILSILLNEITSRKMFVSVHLTKR